MKKLLLKELLLIVTLGMLHYSGLAQVEKYLDKVTLKNGSVLWGITELQNDQLMVHITPEHTLAIPIAEVVTLKKQKLNPRYYLKKVPGTYYQVNWGITLGKSHNENPTETTFNASLAAGYRFTTGLAVGMGTGIYYYPQIRTVPWFVEVQGDMLRGRITPSYFLRTGWGWSTDRNQSGLVADTKSGYYLEPGIGLRWYAGKYSWILKVGYLRQHSETVYEPLDFGNGNIVSNVETRTFERTTISLGLIF